MLSQFLRLSLVAFNGSKNCNRESSKAFYKSYLDRKKQIIENKKLNYYRGAMINWNKAKDEVYLFNEAHQYKASFVFYTSFIERNGKQIMFNEVGAVLGMASFILIIINYLLKAFSNDSDKEWQKTLDMINLKSDVGFLKRTVEILIKEQANMCCKCKDNYLERKRDKYGKVK